MDGALATLPFLSDVEVKVRELQRADELLPASPEIFPKNGEEEESSSFLSSLVDYNRF